MKCDLCDRPAVVHEVTVKGGLKREVHLCEKHAKEAGFALPGFEPVNQLLTQFVVSQPKKRTSRTSHVTCSNCGLTFADFRQSGIVGCPQCYETFDEQLGPLIERAQNGGTHHVGKAPRRAGKSVDRQHMIQRLVRELDCAVAAEQYERAAELRDQLQEIELRQLEPEPDSN